MNKFCSFSRLQLTIRDQEGFLHLFSGSLVINVLIFLLACDEILKAIIHEALNKSAICNGHVETKTVNLIQASIEIFLKAILVFCQRLLCNSHDSRAFILFAVKTK